MIDQLPRDITTLETSPGTYGGTTICRWKNNKTAAYSIGGDDSLRSQLSFAIPEMDRRGLRGTWWVNPGRGGRFNYKNRDDEWAQCWISRYDLWKAAAQRGHDFGNHTMRHMGAITSAEAELEIGQAATIIWKTNPRQRLQLFLRGGSTPWGIASQELERILTRYDCVQGRGGGMEDPTWEVDPDAARLKGYIDAAIQEGSWHHVGFHGIGPDCEWGGPVDGRAFTAMLDYLVEQRDRIWAGTHTQVHKYDQERSSAAITLLQTASSEIRLELTAKKDPRLYDFPLTLRTTLGAKWEQAILSQNGATAQVPVVNGVAQYEALPNKGQIVLRMG